MVLLRHLLGDALRRLRLRQGRTLREVSAAARVSLGYLSEVERGQKEASSELLAAICGALETPLSQVFREVSDNFALAELQSEPVLSGTREPSLRRSENPALAQQAVRTFRGAVPASLNLAGARRAGRRCQARRWREAGRRGRACHQHHQAARWSPGRVRRRGPPDPRHHRHGAGLRLRSAVLVGLRPTSPLARSLMLTRGPSPRTPQLTVAAGRSRSRGVVPAEVTGDTSGSPCRPEPLQLTVAVGCSRPGATRGGRRAAARPRLGGR